VNATDAALFGTLAGAGVALAGSVLTTVVLWHNESRRQKAANYAADKKTLRHHLGVAFTELFALNHALSWITWFAEYAPHRVNQQMRASFDAETHGTFPKLLAAMAMVASINQDVYQELLQLQKQVFDLWEQIARALHQKRGRGIDMKALRGCLPRAEKLDSQLPPELGRMIKMTQSTPRR
jgi:hypothetical protein